MSGTKNISTKEYLRLRQCELLNKGYKLKIDELTKQGEELQGEVLKAASWLTENNRLNTENIKLKDALRIIKTIQGNPPIQLARKMAAKALQAASAQTEQKTNRDWLLVNAVEAEAPGKAIPVLEIKSAEHGRIWLKFIAPSGKKCEVNVGLPSIFFPDFSITSRAIFEWAKDYQRVYELNINGNHETTFQPTNLEQKLGDASPPRQRDDLPPQPWRFNA